MQEGDSPADISPFLLTSFGTGPIDVDDAGNVLWYGEWDDPDGDVNSGLFFNDRLIVQEAISVRDALELANKNLARRSLAKFFAS